jgi:Domain of unknown function (DUF4279)
LKVPEYSDDYPTCAETYSTLRVFSATATPERITDTLGTTPTHSFQKGERFSEGKLERKAHGWFYTTKGTVQSKDTRRHLDAILEVLSGKGPAVDVLRSDGCEIDITSYYVSTGQGGPCVEPYQMRQLGSLEIGVWWDIYFESADEA